MKEFSFGQYYPIDSIVHRLDARVKILITIALITVIFIAKEYTGFAISALFLLMSVAFAKLPLKTVLKTIKPIVILVVFTAILNLFFYQTGEIIWEFYFIKIRKEAISFAIFMAVRLILLVLGSSILTLTTQPVALTDAIESLLKPLKAIKFPVHELALIMSIALRYIPTLMDEVDRIIRAQKARGADFESGNIIRRAKAMLPILIPLLISSFRHAYELADAMDARCYSGGVNRTKFKQFHLTFADLIAGMMTIVLILLVVISNMYTL